MAVNSIDWAVCERGVTSSIVGMGMACEKVSDSGVFAVACDSDSGSYSQAFKRLAGMWQWLGMC